MKKIIVLFIVIIMGMFGLCGCTAFESEDPAEDASQGLTWQEQYDLGMRYLSEGNYEEAILAFTTAIQIDPKQAPAYVGRGDAYVLSGETEENLAAAKADYEKAIELDETSAEAYLGLADVYIRQGDYEKALEILQQGLDTTGDLRLKERISGVRGESEMVQGDEKSFEQLLKSGETDNMLDFEEVTFLRIPFQKLSSDDMAAKMTALGMEVNLYDSQDGKTRHISAHFGRNGSGHHISTLQYNNEPYICLMGCSSYAGMAGNNVSIGIRNLMMNDTIGSLFTALGFSNGNEINDYLCELIYADYDSFDDVKSAFHPPHHYYSNSIFNIQLTGINGSERENGSYGPSQLTFAISFIEHSEYSFSFTFSATAAADFENRLSQFYVHIFRE